MELRAERTVQVLPSITLAQLLQTTDDTNGVSRFHPAHSYVLLFSESCPSKTPASLSVHSCILRSHLRTAPRPTTHRREPGSARASIPPSVLHASIHIKHSATHFPLHSRRHMWCQGWLAIAS